MDHPFSFSPAQFDRIFPFHIRVGNDLKLKGFGSSLVKVISLSEGDLFNNCFTIPRPRCVIKCFDDLVTLQNQVVVLESYPDNQLILRGQFELLEELYLRFYPLGVERESNHRT